MKLKPHNKARSLNLDGDVWHWLAGKSNIVIWSPTNVKFTTSEEEVTNTNCYDLEKDYYKGNAYGVTPYIIRSYIEKSILGIPVSGKKCPVCSDNLVCELAIHFTCNKCSATYGYNNGQWFYKKFIITNDDSNFVWIADGKIGIVSSYKLYKEINADCSIEQFSRGIARKLFYKYYRLLSID